MDIAKRNSLLKEVGDYCYLSKPEDFIEVTEWREMDGFDVVLSANDDVQMFAMTYGQFKLLKKLVKKLSRSRNEY